MTIENSVPSQTELGYVFVSVDHSGPRDAFTVMNPQGLLIIPTTSDTEITAEFKAEKEFRLAWLSLVALGYKVIPTQVSKS